MLNQTPDFYLASSEGYNLEEPRRCFSIKRLRGPHRDDYLLVRIDPPIIGQPYGLGGQDIEKVIVATRFKGDSIFPITEWPVYVHVARFLSGDPEEYDFIHMSDLEEIAWAELYETEAAARRK
jgi:hypothetical protein